MVRILDNINSLQRRMQGARTTASEPKVVARRRSLTQRRVFWRMGPVALCITSVVLIGLMAVLYLSQAAQAVAINQQLQNARREQAHLERQNQDLISIVAQEQSPAYIVEQAKKMGLGPVDPKNLWVVTVNGLQQVSSEKKQSNQP